MINNIHEPSKDHTVTQEYVKQLQLQPLESLIATKKLLRRNSMDISGVENTELEFFTKLMQSEKPQTLFSSFLKR